MEGLEARLKHWANLSEDERNAIKDKNDYPLIAVIDGLPLSERKQIYETLLPRSEYLGHYARKEKEWMLDFVHYLVENRGKSNLDCSHDAIEKILVEEMSQGATHERFRLYCAAKYPQWVAVPFRIMHPLKYLKTRLFLSEVKRAAALVPKSN